MNSNAGVWVKAQTLKEIQYGYDAAMACVNEFKIPNDHPDPGAAVDCINMARDGYEFIKKVTTGLYEQPIPVKQDEDELWERVIVSLDSEMGRFRRDNYIDSINELKSKYSIQLKFTPSPTPVQEGLKEMLVMKDYDGEFEVWSREHYNEYISMSVKHGGGSAYKIVSHFNRNDDLLFPKSEKPKVQEGLREDEKDMGVYENFEKATTIKKESEDEKENQGN